MDQKHIRTACLEPEGAFSYLTGLYWLNEPELVPFQDFNALFRAVEGVITTPERAEALANLRAACGSLQILGSYPQGPELDMKAPDQAKG